jgi:glycerate kinase
VRRVLICPDKFAGTLSAVEAAEALARGWAEAAPADEVLRRPVADGGPGFLSVLAPVTDGRLVDVSTFDPRGRPVTGSVLVAGTTAYLESAQACGLHLLTEAERDPKATTSYGLGVLVTTAVESGVREIVVGLGGSATNDGGAGMLAALGAPPVDAAGYPLPYGGAALLACAGLGGRPRLRDVRLVAASDVDSPLLGPDGASAVYGPQKGATEADVRLLDAALGRFAGVLERDLPGCPPGLAARAGAGAAGGLGAAILACGGRVESGFGLVASLTRLDAALADCDVVVTGEGRFDEQSLRGKVVAGVARAARDRGVPCVVVAGQVAPDGAADAGAAGIAEVVALADVVGGVDQALAHPAQALRTAAARVAARWGG